jgi:hypothetical protein
MVVKWPAVVRLTFDPAGDAADGNEYWTTRLAVRPRDRDQGELRCEMVSYVYRVGPHFITRVWTGIGWRSHNDKELEDLPVSGGETVVVNRVVLAYFHRVD